MYGSKLMSGGVRICLLFVFRSDLGGYIDGGSDCDGLVEILSSLVL